MGAKIIAAVAFLVIVVLVGYQWRLKSRQEWQKHDLNAIISRNIDAVRKEVAATDNLPANDERRLAALKRLADCDWQENKLDDAAKILSDLWSKYDKQQKPGYDNEFVDVMLMMAGVHRDQGNVRTAQQNYEQVYYYDLHHTDAATQKRIARDLNNLGVAYYMLGLSKPKKIDGLSDYQKSIDYFEEALKAYRQLYGKDSQYEANALYNESLPLRDSDQNVRAQEARARSNAIMALVKRPCDLP